ncbi:MAG: MFS transporter [Promethearchaeota archaeon]
MRNFNDTRKSIPLLCLIRLVHGFGAGMFDVVYQPFLLDLTGSLFIIGILITLGSIMQFLPTPIIGRLSDKYGRKKIALMSIPTYIIGLSFLIISTQNSIILISMGILFYFLGFPINDMNIQFLVSESSEKSKGMMYGVTMFSLFSGRIGGNLFVIFFQGFDTRIYFMIYIVLLVLEGIIILILPIKNGIKKDKEIITPDEKVKNNKIWLKMIKEPRMRAILIFFTADIIIYSIPLSIYTGGLRDYYGLTYENIAFISFWLNLTNMVFQIPAGKITDKIGKKLALFLSETFGLTFFTLNIIGSILWSMGFNNLLLLFLVLANISFGFSVVTFIPAELIILTDLDRERKAELFGIISFIRGIGTIPTGVIGGFLIVNVGYISPFIIAFLGIIFEIWFLLRYFKD